MSTVCITIQGKLRDKIFSLWSKNRDGKLESKPEDLFYIPPIEGSLLGGEAYAEYYNWQQTIVHHLVERGLADFERSIAPQKIPE